MKIAVHVPTQYQSEAVQKACFDRNRYWSNGSKDISYQANDTYGQEACINIGIGGNSIMLASKGFYVKEGYTVISTDEFFANIGKYLFPTIRIEEYRITDITSKGFKVGCQFVSWEQYEAIGKLRPGE